MQIHTQPNISRSKDNQAMSKLIEHNKINFFSSKIMRKMRQGHQFQNSFYLTA